MVWMDIWMNIFNYANDYETYYENITLGRRYITYALKLI